MHDDRPDPQTAATREVVMRYHFTWKARDIEAVLALYHPEVQYNDFFQNRSMGRDALREYLLATMPSGPEDFLEHNDRIRVDGDTAFIQYAISVAGGGTFRASEAITVRDGLIWRINEYALLVQPPAQPGKPASQRPIIGWETSGPTWLRASAGRRDASGCASPATSTRCRWVRPPGTRIPSPARPMQGGFTAVEPAT